MNKTKRLMIVFLVIILLASICCSAFAAASDDEITLRVGYMDYNGFIDQNPDGSYSGYGADYLDAISEYTGYKYEYVYGEWSQLLEMLANGEIDLLCMAQYTDERAAVYDYSAYPIGYTQGLLYTQLDNDALCYEDFESFEGITIGTLRDSAMRQVLFEYAEQQGFSFVEKQYNSEEELLVALNSGEVDAMCSEHLANHSGLSLMANIGADAYYIISYKGSPYIPEINFALQEIKTDVDFEAELYHKYYDSSTAASAIQFTRQEKEYIESHGTVVVGLMQDRSPLSYENENGQAAGMLVDIMDIVAAQSGLTFEYRFLDVGQTGYDFLANGCGDLVAGVASSAFSTPNPALLQSNTLQSGSVVFVGREGTDFSADAALTVALPAAFINGEAVVAAQYPNFNFYYGVSNKECLKAVRDGQADVMLQNLYVIRECLQSPLFDGLDTFPAFSFTEEEKVVALPENELLMSIVNKAIDGITDEQQNNVVINNTIAKSYHAKTGEILYKYRYPLIGVAVLLTTIMAMLLTMLIVRQRNYLAMEKVNAKLEKTNGQLEEAVLQADRANTAKSQFLSRMSHEIRTPMNAIVGLTEIAKQHEADPLKIDDYLGKIAVSSKVLLSILNDVLDMSAIESGRLKLANDKFDIKQVLGGISTIYYRMLDYKGDHTAASSSESDETGNAHSDPTREGLCEKKVLLCEDNLINAEITRRMLEEAGCRMELAENGRRGLEMFSEAPSGFYDAILMDIRMPVMDGIEATQRIRALNREDARSIPIIALTANSYEEDVQKTKAAGMNAHLTKPVDPSVLYKTLSASIIAAQREA